MEINLMSTDDVTNREHVTMQRVEGKPLVDILHYRSVIDPTLQAGYGIHIVSMMRKLLELTIV